jgi:hypothetical protein
MLISVESSAIRAATVGRSVPTSAWQFAVGVG